MVLVVALLVIREEALMTIVVTHEEQTMPMFLSIKTELCSGNFGKTGNADNFDFSGTSSAIGHLTLPTCPRRW